MPMAQAVLFAFYDSYFFLLSSKFTVQAKNHWEYFKMQNYKDTRNKSKECSICRAAEKGKESTSERNSSIRG